LELASTLAISAFAPVSVAARRPRFNIYRQRSASVMVSVAARISVLMTYLNQAGGRLSE
jgi:hypothetical protein